ncbi:MAG: DUF4328 domain-containing protein [Rubrivivax sp.]|nr:DUF4328 domain-containing protein [Pyrinomonadaceae bacterium]
MQPLTATTPFRSGHGRAVVVTFLLAASIVVSVLGAFSTLAKIATGAASQLPNDEELSIGNFVDLGVYLLHFVVYFSTVVAFCMWLYRACKNLPALGNPKPVIDYSPAWAVGSFFVPFANLIIPFRAVRETWAKSDPAVPYDNYVAPTEPSAPLIMNVWWAFWLISNFVANAALRVWMRAETPGALYVATWLDLFSDLFTIPAAIFAIFVVKEVDRRQEERSRRVVYAPQAPPPPPLFTTPPAPGARPFVL